MRVRGSSVPFVKRKPIARLAVATKPALPATEAVTVKPLQPLQPSPTRSTEAPAPYFNPHGPTRGALQGDDYPLEYYEDGHPKLPACLDRRPKPPIAEGCMITIPTARVFGPLLQPARYLGAWGGRGSGKSWFFAEKLVERSLLQPGLRAVCVREVQRTLAQSAKRLIEDKIQRRRQGVSTALRPD